jgi:hypothetical protein
LLQFATNRFIAQENLESSIHECIGSLPKTSSTIKQADIYSTAELLASLKKENIPAFTRFDDCMISQGWFLISTKPWLDIDELNVIPPPIAPTEQEKLSPVAHNETLAIYWAADIVEKGSLISYSQAVEYIRAMNAEDHSGRSNWRLPTEDELRIIGNTLSSYRKLNDSSGGAVRSGWKWHGPFWMASDEKDENALAVKIPDGELMLLPNTAPFVAQLLPVSGTGWNSRISNFAKGFNNSYSEFWPGKSLRSLALPYQEMKFLRYSTINRTPTPVAPLGR